jgi:zinc transport system permease protein
MIYAMILGAVFCTAGLSLSYALDIASGASIVIFSVAGYLVSYTIRAFHVKHRRKAPVPTGTENV